MKKVLFIDRDGTILVEPPDYQVDTMDKLAFVPGVISALKRIANDLDYELVMVTNQDGLGTAALPEEAFWPPHNKMLEILTGEGISFSEVLIDPTLPEEMAPTRKPGTAMLTAYMSGDYDLDNSFVIGDRTTDIELAKNLGARAIYIAEKSHDGAALTTKNWDEIYLFLRGSARSAHVVRKSKETHIQLWLELDGTGQYDIRTGLSFFDHMLEQFARHSGCNLRVTVEGDLHVDEHHTIEDTAIVLGEALREALGSKKGLARFGFVLPMDDALAQVAVDLSGRSWLYWQAAFNREKIGDVPTEMFSHFFKSFSDAARCNLNIQAEGQNEHHKIEAIFKALAKAVKMAIAIDDRSDAIPTTKGLL